MPEDTAPEAQDRAAAPTPADAEAERLRRENESLKAELDAARREAAENLDRARRTLADFENFRRRTRAESQAAREKAKEELLQEMLAVLDNFDRAFEHAGDEESLYEGVKLIFRQFQSIMEKQGLSRIDTEGHPFDPLLHEAVMREPTRAYRDGTIIKELERGYYLNGKVLRPAKVKVAVAPPQEPPSEE